MMMRDVSLEQVTIRNKRTKMSFKRKRVEQPSTVQKRSDSDGYRVVEVAKRL